MLREEKSFAARSLAGTPASRCRKQWRRTSIIYYWPGSVWKQAVCQPTALKIRRLRWA